VILLDFLECFSYNRGRFAGVLMLFRFFKNEGPAQTAEKEHIL